jgi:hypothetical protein
MIKIKKILGASALCLTAFACEQSNEIQQRKPLDSSPIFSDQFADASGRTSQAPYAVFSAEYLTTGESGQLGRTVFFKDVGNKQLAADFVPGMSLDGTDAVSYYVDETRPSDDLGASVTSGAITRAMNTWNAISCSDLGMVRVPSNRRTTTGFIAELARLRGSFDYVADVVHAGWLPGSFFDLIAKDGSQFILAVTYTIVFTDEKGNVTDVDNNRKLDVAWREIYYNDAFAWADGKHYDVETIALHEAGHGLSQDHFGEAFLDAGTGQLHFSPRAVMNAAYSGIQTSITETDNAGHCSIWGSWSQN